MKNLKVKGIIALVSAVVCSATVPAVAAERGNRKEIAYPDELTLKVCQKSDIYDEGVDYILPRVDEELNIYSFTCPEGMSVTPENSLIIWTDSPEIDLIGGDGLPIQFEEDITVSANTNSLPFSFDEEWNGVIWLKMNGNGLGTVVFSNDKSYVPEWASHLVFSYPDELVLVVYDELDGGLDTDRYPFPMVDDTQNLYRLTCPDGVTITPEKRMLIFGEKDVFMDISTGSPSQLCMLDEEFPVSAYTNGLDWKLNEDWNGVMWLKMNDDLRGTVIFSNDRSFVPECAQHLSGIGSITDTEETVTRYFDLQGIETANPGKGLYIRVKGDRSEKVLL